MRAAIRRGSSTSTSPAPSASSAGGTRVVFPAPGGASMTRLRSRVSRETISGTSGSMGRGVKYYRGTDPRRFRANSRINPPASSATVEGSGTE